MKYQHKLLIKTVIASFLLFTVYCLLPTAYSLLPTPYSLAQTPDYDQVNEIAKKLNCPTCTGINLADCRTQTCEQWREQINDLLKQGYTDEEVINYFTARYGSEVLQEPPKSGWTLALWMGPLVLLLLGGGLLFYAMHSWRAQKTVATSIGPSIMASEEAPSAPGNYLRQVEHDLRYSNNDE
jgi:cytochrome c-type biogenesis protein CcmH